MPESLGEQAEKFASSLTETLNASICDQADLSVVEHKASGVFYIAHRNTPDEVLGSPIPVTEFPEHLFLNVYWRFGASSTGEFLRTELSQFALYVWSPKREPHPLLRLEVDAERDKNAWNVAHIQVHATSQLLGQVWGLRKIERPRRLEALHLPVGGFQYRPCLEDFIEFLIEEKLVPAKEGWRNAIDRTREEYRRIQLKSLVAKHPEVASEALTPSPQAEEE